MARIAMALAGMAGFVASAEAGNRGAPYYGLLDYAIY